MPSLVFKHKHFQFKNDGEFAHESAFNFPIDINGDGAIDFIAMGTLLPLDKPVPLHLMVNDGKGNFTDQTTKYFPSVIPGTVSVPFVAIADFNGDGRPDLFAGDQGLDLPPAPGGQNLLLLSNGKIGFINASDRLPQQRDSTHSVTAGDVDKDGDIDLLSMNITGGEPPIGPQTAPYFLINDGTGHFQRSDDRLPADIVNREPDWQYTACGLFDVDGDGDADLFLGAAHDDRSYIVINDGSGNFSDPNSFIALPEFSDYGVLSVSPGDLNGDGAIDLVVMVDLGPPNNFTIAREILINDGTGHFHDETLARHPQAFERIGPTANDRTFVQDFNGDGYLDLVAHTGLIQPFFINDGSGHFIQLPKAFFKSKDWDENNIMDVNGDGKLDFLVYRGGIGIIIEDLYIQRAQGKNIVGTEKGDGLLGEGSKETITGLVGADIVFGAAGNDRILGGSGADYLNGGVGNDRIEGETGADTIVGALGKDKLTGGGGKDVFKFNTILDSVVGREHDVIRHFKNDRIDLSFIDADTTVISDQAFTFIGAESFAAHIASHQGARGLARFESGLLQADLDGNGVADFEVKVGSNFEANDLIL